eukprot:scaffold104557_cov68-Phaeocystis_antarctica.AAC.1
MGRRSYRAPSLLSTQTRTSPLFAVETRVLKRSGPPVTRFNANAFRFGAPRNPAMRVATTGSTSEASARSVIQTVTTGLPVLGPAGPPRPLSPIPLAEATAAGPGSSAEHDATQSASSMAPRRRGVRTAPPFPPPSRRLTTMWPKKASKIEKRTEVFPADDVASVCVQG